MKHQLYNNLAYVYDKLYNYIDYKIEVDFVHRIATTLFHPNTTIHVLDLACGTGRHIEEYVKFQYKTTGLDINPGILNIAKDNNQKAEFIKCDLNELSLIKKYNIISCFSSSIQYITDPKKLSSTLKMIYDHLTEPGILVFNIRYSKENWQEGYVSVNTHSDNEEEIVMLAKSRSHNNISYWDPVIFIKKNNKLDMYLDHHEIRIYSIKEITTILKNIGFKVNIYSDFTDKPHTKKNTNPVIVAIK